MDNSFFLAAIGTQDITMQATNTACQHLLAQLLLNGIPFSALQASTPDKQQIGPSAHLTSTKLSGKYAARCDQQEDDAVWGRDDGELHGED